MSKSKSSDTYSGDEQQSQTSDLNVYDVMDALLGAKAAAVELLKFKRHLPAEGFEELKELTKELTRAIHAAACDDLGNIPAEIRQSTLLLDADSSGLPGSLDESEKTGSSGSTTRKRQVL